MLLSGCFLLIKPLDKAPPHYAVKTVNLIRLSGITLLLALDPWGK
ncbi:hypothetical protein EV13_0217 [Prochlorococcus sp. MIT 0702]|nr:hypothetical protein EV12_1828 [Prochlorococcus sp. MIT 0701]KGG30454.1 hypothetical protein EV13_0217 [Prochlorococcus sp. MIT 0702]KGG34008.1 hypothetical protein EV14_1548 [Prochlorococcus sp. MIT 0703]